jgi:glutathione S-transferase
MSSSSRVVFVNHPMCPFAQRTHICLLESGLAFEEKKIGLYGPGGKPKWFMELNPKGEVPVLATPDGPVVDSELTLDWIAANCESDSLYPKGKEAKIDRVRHVVNGKIKVKGKEAVLCGGVKEKRELGEALEELEAEISGPGPYFGGENFCLADVSAFPFLWRINDEFGIPNDCHKLKSWLSICRSLPSVSATIQASWWWWW